ncbi:hypothetical protein O6H91_10G067300 [Diphasiastrum complanatum]|uniref:Uncharacterized protein n=1 Tax=Diphasiastrum complanatum TaxID=34168 RepID=A0ACC2CI30_DIPCM|nr:hypothetical protein O6H91_10G067300 [Diphasiastrum complanatum]
MAAIFHNAASLPSSSASSSSSAAGRLFCTFIPCQQSSFLPEPQMGASSLTTSSANGLCQFPSTKNVLRGPRRLRLACEAPEVEKLDNKVCLNFMKFVFDSKKVHSYLQHRPISLEHEKAIIAITGATGFIGTRLVQTLVAGGHEVRVLTHSASNARSLFSGNMYRRVIIAEENDWPQFVQGSTGVINLAGPPISTRWNAEVKAKIKTARIEVTKKVVEAINRTPQELRPSVLVSATAVGYYGTSENYTFDETSPSGNDYLSEVCREWEATAEKVDSTVRLVLVRIGVVLDKDGGALAKMLPIFKAFAGGPLGSGKQWFSWIHRDDLVSLLVEALSNPAYKGVINGTAPNPVRMGEMCNRLGVVLGRPSWLPVPEIALKAILGEGAFVVLEGQRVIPKKAQELGFDFKYRYVADALKASVTS